MSLAHRKNIRRYKNGLLTKRRPKETIIKSKRLVLDFYTDTSLVNSYYEQTIVFLDSFFLRLVRQPINFMAII